VADPGKTALIVIDMLNTYEHDDAEPLRKSVRPILPTFERLLARARDSSSLLVYVNDNYGRWHDGPAELIDRAAGGPYRELVEPIAPPPGTPFVVKARHSIFYQTPLEYLLRDEGVSRLVLAGQVTEQCVLYSALDAYVRHFDVAVCRDAVAAIDPALAEAALVMMGRNMHADITETADCRL
jgi:nicotinamidase-related amidase